MGPTIVVTDHTFDNLSIEHEQLDGLNATIIDGETSEKPLTDLIADADAIIVMYDQIDEELLNQAPDLKVVSRTGIGVDNVDVDAATDRGIVVTNVPDYCIAEVSDHTIALMLALLRNVVTFNEITQTGGWDLTAGREMHRLTTQTLGLVAFGKTAQEINRKASAFGMDVLAWDPYLDPTDIEAEGATPVDDIDDLLEAADVVSVHPPLTPETRGLIGDEELDTMRESAVLLNVARGGIVDESALATALDNGDIAGAGIDVVAEEPPGDDHPLVGRDDVILTPHAAWNSVESIEELRRKATANVRAVLEDERPSYVVNEGLFE